MISFDRVSTRRRQLRFGRPAVGRKPADVLRWCCLFRARPESSPSSASSPSPARLRTGTSYKAGSVRRVSQSSRSRSQRTAQVNDELVQGQFTFLSGEICITRRSLPCIDASMVINAALRGRISNRRVCVLLGDGSGHGGNIVADGAEVSRGRSTACNNPLAAGRTEQ